MEIDEEKAKKIKFKYKECIFISSIIEINNFEVASIVRLPLDIKDKQNHIAATIL